jgi:hypothetical protein
MSVVGILVRKTGSFIGLPWSTKLLFAEAILTTAYVKITLLFLPFSKVAGWLGTAHHVYAGVILPGAEIKVKKVRLTIKLCDRYVPWPTECYTRALTAKIMLKRRKIASTLYFGFRKDPTGELKGHAWLRCGGIVVTGFCDFSKYVVHSSFC